MGLIINSKKYKCSDDCRQSGCPEHEVSLMYHSVSDSYTFKNRNGKIIHFESEELQAFIYLLKELNRADSIQI